MTSERSLKTTARSTVRTVRPADLRLNDQCEQSSDTGQSAARPVEATPLATVNSERSEHWSNLKVNDQCACSDSDCTSTGRTLKGTGHAKDCRGKDCQYGCPDVSQKAVRKVAKGGKKLMHGQLRKGSKEWAEERMKVHVRSSEICEVKETCRDLAGRAARAVHVHHRHLRKHGGSDYAENLLDLCDACHKWVHAHPKVSYENGWLIHSWGAA
jgi:hypothetical protein